MTFKDLVGLSQPLTKLIEVVSKGVGKTFEPFLIKLIADADAKKIKIISDAIKTTHSDIEYVDEKIKIISKVGSGYKEDITATDRAFSRLIFQETKKQINLENVISFSANELYTEKDTTNKKVNDNWINQFFKLAEDISDNKMQCLWGKILAGEIKHPGSFSLRTLDTLKNLDQDEANIFLKYAKLACIPKFNDDIAYAFIESVAHPSNNEFFNKYNISNDDIWLLEELNLIENDNVIYEFKNNDQMHYKIADYNVNFFATNKQDIKISVRRFTKIGKDLLKLIDTTELNKDYIEYIKKKWGANEVEIDNIKNK